MFKTKNIISFAIQSLLEKIDSVFIRSTKLYINVNGLETTTFIQHVM